MSRIMVTGGGGQVASALAALAAAEGVEIVRVGRPEFDFDRPETVAACFRRVGPDLVVNAAAYTAVDRAETEQDAAWRANHAGPCLLAELCAAAGARLLHISTDYVFDGGKTLPYVESDPTGPTGVYGASKLAGERAVMQRLADAIVLRTSWVYAAAGRNFLLTMLNAARHAERLRVVSDQLGCPTLAADLAAVILRIAVQPGWQGGLYHAAGAGETSWHGFACAIFDRAATHGMRAPSIEAVATADWPTPAQRPANSRLDCTKLQTVFGAVLPRWQDSVARTVDAVLGAPDGAPPASRR